MKNLTIGSLVILTVVVYLLTVLCGFVELTYAGMMGIVPLFLRKQDIAYGILFGVSLDCCDGEVSSDADMDDCHEEFGETLERVLYGENDPCGRFLGMKYRQFLVSVASWSESYFQGQSGDLIFDLDGFISSRILYFAKPTFSKHCAIKLDSAPYTIQWEYGKADSTVRLVERHFNKLSR